MPHFYVKPEHIRQGRFIIDGEDSHHLQHVLRKKIGDVIRMFDGKSRAYQGIIETLKPHEIIGTIIDRKDTTDEAGVQIHLFQSLPKGSKFDFIIEKCTELGVSSITPVISERCIKKITPEESLKKKDRWGKIARSASEQCGRDSIPIIHPLKYFVDAVKQTSHDAVQLIPWEGEEHCSLKAALHRGVIKGEKNIPAVNIWIGPEGGFSLQEITLARENNMHTVTLGKHILRTETAGLVTLALIQYELDNL